MKNNRYKLLELVPLLIVVLLIPFCGYLLYSIDKLQYQVFERNTLLQEQSQRDSTSRHDYDELINSLNKLLVDAPIDENGKFDVPKFIRYHNNLKDSIGKLNGAIQQLETNLELIRSNYGIETAITKRKIDKNTIRTTTSIKGNDKVDSALILLPHFKDRLTLLEDGTWNIKVVSDKHNKLRSDYNSLNKRYQELAEEYDEKVNFYKNILRKMADKDLIEIKENSDSTTTYTY